MNMDADRLLDAIQWPAMAVTLFAAWLVASRSPRRRAHGFWWFIASNILWITWGWHDGAWALIALQVGLFTLNVRGALKNEKETEKQEEKSVSRNDKQPENK